jgi:hypothetical protein
VKTPPLNRRLDGTLSQHGHFGIEDYNVTYTHNTYTTMSAATKIICITKYGTLQNLGTLAQESHPFVLHKAVGVMLLHHKVLEHFIVTL